jgi:uncharacterized LabA/DUF88 family protein
MPTEPTIKNAIVFIDGQNLFYGIRDAFGYCYPNYDVQLLSQKICQEKGWQLRQVRFYTGVPDINDKPFWHNFWSNKLTLMGQKGVKVFSRKLRYRNETIKLPDGKTHTFLVGQEKGVDVRIALDIIRLVREKAADVYVVLSQDQDLSEVADEIKVISKEDGRWIKMASAFPVSPTLKNGRGINGTDWIKIDRAMYDLCIDSNDYRR